jgi:hypothetical protein
MRTVVEAAAVAEYGQGWAQLGYTEQVAKAVEDMVRDRLEDADQWRVRFVYGDERAEGIYVLVNVRNGREDLAAEVCLCVSQITAAEQAFRPFVTNALDTDEPVRA